MAKDVIKANPSMHTSGNWRWWEFENGLIIAKATIGLSYTPDGAAGAIYQTTSLISLGKTPFSFSNGSFTAIATQLQWAANQNVNASTGELSCRFISTVSSARSPTVDIIFVGQK